MFRRKTTAFRPHPGHLYVPGLVARDVRYPNRTILTSLTERETGCFV